MRILTILVCDHLGYSMLQELIIWSCRVLSWFSLIQKLASEVNNMEQIIDHDDVVLAIFRVDMIFRNIFLSELVSTI